MTMMADPENKETRALSGIADLAGRHVLEIGCGDGRLTWRYARKVRRVTGIELDMDELRLATVDRPAALEARVALVRTDSIQLPFRRDTFDIAILAWSL